MSWLGVNLNDSLSSLKGQLSNLTREVLSEGVEDVEDNDTQVLVPRDRIKELESLCQLQKHEVEESKRARAEVEERLHAADLHAAHQVNLLRHQLQERETELRKLKENITEWGWEVGDGGPTHNHTPDHHDGLHGADQHNHNHQPSPQPENTKQQAWQEQLNQQLSRRVEELEGELRALKDSHQYEVAALQDQHRHQLHALRHTEGRDITSLSPKTTTTHESDDGLSEQASVTAAENGSDSPCTEQWKQLERHNTHLQNSLHELQKELGETKQKAESVRELEKRLSTLSEECTALRTENEQNDKNLEELDSQYQAAIEIILKKKNDLQEEARVMKKTHDQLTQLVAQLQEDQAKQEQEAQRLQVELLKFQENEETSRVTCNEHLEQLNNLKAQLSDKCTSLSHLEAQVQQLYQEKQSYKSEDKYEELCQCNAQLKTTLEKVEAELQQVRLSEANLKETRDATAAENASLTEQLESQREEKSKLTVSATERKAIHDAKKEDMIQKKELEEKLATIETAKNNLEQELHNNHRALEDAKARSGMLESELQAKVQEITMFNTTIAELEAKIKHMETDIQDHQKSKREEMEEVNKGLVHDTQEGPKTVKAGVHRLAELLRESVWQRDTLEHHVSTITQELREKNEQLNEGEATRTELERECEDLRDQLEEIQKGIRPPPEGSSRGLPTIEEETEGGAEGDADVEQVEERQTVKAYERSASAERDRSSEIEAFQVQVEALSEARRNLETEVSNLRAEREALQGRLREAEGRTGNLANLETEAAALRNQKKALEMRLASLTQQLDLETVTLQDERDTLKDQVDNLHEKLECLRMEMSLSKHERESIGQQLLNQYQVVENRDATIRVLEGELDGLRDKLRESFGAASSSSDSILHHQEKAAKLQEELDAIKSQLIFKEDKIDALSQVLEDVGQIFQIDVTNIDNVHKQIRDKYLSSENSLEEKDQRIEELSNTNRDLHLELDLCKKHNSEIGTEYATKITEKEKELNSVKEQLEKNETEVFHFREKVAEFSGELNNKEQSAMAMQDELNTVKVEKNGALSMLNQRTEELANMNEEYSRLQNEFSSEKELVLHLKQEIEELKVSQGHQLTEQMGMNDIVREKDNELKEKDAKLSSLLQQIDQLEKEKTELLTKERENKSLASDNQNLNKQEQALRNENSQLLQDKNSLLEEKEKWSREIQEVEGAKSVAQQQLTSLQSERDHMIAAITQKHQESVSYHTEIQRLTQVLNQTTQQSTEENNTLSSQLHESEALLTETRGIVLKLREELDAMKLTQSELQKNAADGIVQKTEASGLRKEVESLRTKFTVVEQERDQLRVANSRFNTQYQDQSKELSNIREKEGRLATECERLRQHLVAVEESYTAEAIKAEERESTLRSTLTKMEEKLNNHSNFYNSANQRASVQVETLHEQVREMTAKRDDAVLRLQTAEENAEQYQQSLATLQQVLQDFQKNQVREIAEATERTRRQLEEEKEISSSFMAQANSLKTQLAEAQGGLAAASRLGEQLTKKEQMIVALKAQVSSQEEVARKARDEVMCLKSSSEAKVEKPLLRNLLVGYFATPADKRQEVLRIIAEVLNFSGEERARTGLDMQGTSWLTSIANFLAPPASNVRVTSKVDVLDHTSLSQAFIRFLEDESNPRPQARLPAVLMAQQTTEKAEKKAQAKAQAANKMNPFISIGEASASANESGSRNSSPLLAAASTPPTLPTITPLEPTSPSPLIAPTSVTPSTVMTTSGFPTPVSTNKYLSNLLTSEPGGKADENANKQPS
ncbi:thyroid receptor-interacting protein 11-like [Homarus americanus]|uniref:thyroid receptor-interacting protein 11-like n=1 Tax=Homarus americanus TaxID=6706 RepID=UPI001C44D92F|nr:thyroid receptor-interacting protein 11-like [Homarus americanus]